MGNAVPAEMTAGAESFDVQQPLMMLPEAEQLAALREYLTAATAKDCSVMVALQASSPVHLTPASNVTFCGGHVPDDGASPAMGRFLNTEESSIAFKVRPPCIRAVGSVLARSTRRAP